MIWNEHFVLIAMHRKALVYSFVFSFVPTALCYDYVVVGGGAGSVSASDCASSQN